MEQRLDDDHFPARVKSCAVQLAQNSSGALGDLFDLTAARAVRFALTITRNLHDAEDALQTAFVRVATNPLALADAWHPWAYLLQMVRNEALKIAQRRRVDQLVPVSLEARSYESVDDADARRFVRQALGKLPPNQAEVVILKVWEGLTLAEIAHVLGESPNTAASRYRYALEKLTRLLRPLAEEASSEDAVADVPTHERSLAAR